MAASADAARHSKVETKARAAWPITILSMQSVQI
jgi:hypothetical protein